MIRRFVQPLAIAALLALAACAPPQIHHGQLIALDKGMTMDLVSQRLGLPPIAEHRANVAGREFVFQQYRMNNGMQLDRYLVAFEPQRVVFWGYIDEFRRHPDPVMGQALNQVLPQVLERR